MNTMRLVAALAVLAAGTAYGQNVIAARAGLVQHIEGKVLLDGKAVEASYTRFPEVRDGQTLKTEEGRAEVLLGPGSFLRLGENTAFRMDSSRLTDIRLEILSGSALLEVAELPKEAELSVVFAGRTISFRKNGLYRFDSDPGKFRVYDGEARVANGAETMTVKKGREVEFGSAVLVAEKFDTKVGDELYRWASHRAGYIAMANVSSAKSIYDRGMPWNASGWYWNPWYQMYTFIPFRGQYMSPFGYGFWSPAQVMYALNPYYYGYRNPGYNSGGGGIDRGVRYDPNLGYNVGSRSGGYYGGGGSVGSSGSVGGSTGGAAASSAGSARGGGGGAGSSSGGGRR